MKKVILILMVISVQAFAWFGLELKEEKVVIDGYSLSVIDLEKNNEFVFKDSFSIKRDDNNIKSNMEKRIKIVFDKINSVGLEKGFKSFTLISNGFNVGEIGINSGEDVAKYCTLNMTDEPNKYGPYFDYCSIGKNPILDGGGYINNLRIKIIYFKDSSGMFQIK